MKIYIDLETIAAQSETAIAMIKEGINKKISNLKAPSNYGEVKAVEWVVKKAAELEVGFTEAHLKTSFDGGLGEIITIGYKIGDHETMALRRRQGESEADLLSLFFLELNNSIKLKGGSNNHLQWIGHNLIKFDLPFLFKRCVINNVIPSVDIPVNSRHGNSVFDTMYAWAGYGGMISQDNLCKTLGLPLKQGMDGSKVYQAWLDGKYDEIADYCKDDVNTVYALYNRLNFII